MTIKILLTRSSEENQLLALTVQQINLHPVKLNLIEFINYNFDFAKLKNYQKVILTSKYAVQLLAKYLSNNQKDFCRYKNIKFYNVGTTSAQILKKLGLNIDYTAANVEELYQYFSNLNCQNSVYLSGENIAKEFMPGIKRKIIYKVRYRDKIDEQDLKILSQGIDYILLYSLACAKILVNLFNKYQLNYILYNAKYITLSKKVMKYISKYNNNIQYVSTINFENLKQLVND